MWVCGCCGLLSTRQQQRHPLCATALISSRLTLPPMASAHTRTRITNRFFFRVNFFLTFLFCFVNAAFLFYFLPLFSSVASSVFVSFSLPNVLASFCGGVSCPLASVDGHSYIPPLANTNNKKDVDQIASPHTCTCIPCDQNRVSAVVHAHGSPATVCFFFSFLSLF